MTSDNPSPDHATLEAQRRRSNVYAFRRLKWGDPRKGLKSSARGNWAKGRSGRLSTPVPLRSRQGRAWGLALFAVVAFVVAVLAIGL